jgi:CRISPR/Cas system CSM-associated protein Csm2 small subunit
MVKAIESHRIFISKEDKMGFQAIISRKILKNEVIKIKNIPQIIGWRHSPKSHERKRCLCPACLTLGSYNSNNIKKNKLNKLLKELNNTTEKKEIKDILYDISELSINWKTKDEQLNKRLLEIKNEYKEYIE